MIRRFRDWWRERGLALPIALAWFPFWLALSLLLSDRTASLVCLGIMAAPIALGIIWTWAMFVICIREPEHFAVAAVFGVPIVMIVAGTAIGTAIVGASALLWIGSRAVARWRGWETA